MDNYLAKLRTLVFTDNPFFGVGPGNFDADKLSYIEEGLLTSYICELDFAGNNFFDTLHGVDIFSTSWCFLLMVRLLCTAVNIC